MASEYILQVLSGMNLEVLPSFIQAVSTVVLVVVTWHYAKMVSKQAKQQEHQLLYQDRKEHHESLQHLLRHIQDKIKEPSYGVLVGYGGTWLNPIDEEGVEEKILSEDILDQPLYQTGDLEHHYPKIVALVKDLEEIFEEYLEIRNKTEDIIANDEIESKLGELVGGDIEFGRPPQFYIFYNLLSSTVNENKEDFAFSDNLVWDKSVWREDDKDKLRIREKSYNGAYSKIFFSTTNTECDPEAEDVNAKLSELIEDNEELRELILDAKDVIESYEETLDDLNYEINHALEYTNLRKDCSFVPEYVE